MAAQFVSYAPFEIPLQDVTVIWRDCLGEGYFGSVYKGFYKGYPVAVKILSNERTTPKEFLQEAYALKKLIHPNVLTVYGVCPQAVTRQGGAYIVTEFMENGSLVEYLRVYGSTMPERKKVMFAVQIAKGMGHLEANNFVHRDLAARNVLVGKDDLVKVADFGLTRQMETYVYEARNGAACPVRWTAPEALAENRYSTKSDVWSFGVVLWEIFMNGAVPYGASFTNQKVEQYITQGGRLSKPTYCSNCVYNIMLECWDKNPNKRPSFGAIQAKLHAS